MKTVFVIISILSFISFSSAQKNCYNEFGFSVGYPGTLADYTDIKKPGTSNGIISLSLFTNSQISFNLHHSMKFGLQLNYTKLKIEGAKDIYFTDDNGTVIGNGIINNLSILTAGLPLTYSFTKNSRVRYNIGLIPQLRLAHKYVLSNSSDGQETNIPSYVYNLRKTNVAAYLGVGFLQSLGAGVDLEITPFAQMNILSDSYNSTFGSHRYIQVGLSFGFIPSKA